MTKDEYCISVCKAKCCYWHDVKKPCPRLTEDCKCSIYEQRFGPDSAHVEIVGWAEKYPGTVLPFICSRIEQLIKDKHLPDDVEAQCCYAHPELLEVL